MCDKHEAGPDGPIGPGHAHPDDRASLARLARMATEAANDRRRRHDRWILRAAIITAVLGHVMLIATLLFEQHYGPICPPPATHTGEQHGTHHP